MKKYSKEKCESKMEKLQDKYLKWEHRLKEYEKEFTGWAKVSEEHEDYVGNELWMHYYEDGIIKYGFDSNGEYKENNSGCKYDITDVPATEEEVKQALIKEAIKRGFKEGARFTHNEDVHAILKGDVSEIHSDFFEIKNNTFMIDGWEIFNDGKWAEIIEEPVYEYQWLRNCNTVTRNFHTDYEKTSYFVKPIEETKRLRKCNK